MYRERGSLFLIFLAISFGDLRCNCARDARRPQSRDEA